MDLFYYEEERTEYAHLYKSLERIACSAAVVAVLILLWAGSKLIVGSEL